MKLTQCRYITLLCLSLGLFYTMTAQMPVYKNYTTVDGLPSDNIYSVTQDGEGFIWFSTDNGVSRFDGTRFKNFSKADGVSDNDVLRTLMDSKGRLWFLTFNGKLSYYSDGRVFNADNDTVLRNIHFNSAVTYAFEDSKHNIWIGSNDRQVDEITPTGEVKIFEGITMLDGWEDERGRIRILVSGALITIQNGKVHTQINDQYFNSRTGVRLPGDSLVLIPIQDEVAICNGNGRILSKQRIPAFNAAIHQNVSVDRHENIWFSTLDGVVEIDSGSILSGQEHRFLIHNSITYTYQDREGNLWFSSYGTGVFMIPSLYTHVYDSKSGLVESNITAVAALPNGSWMVGSHNGSIQIIEHDSIAGKGSSLIPPSGIIMKIKNDGNGNTYIMTNVSLYRYRDGVFTRVKDSIGWYKSIYMASDGTPWIGRGTGIGKITNDRVVNDYRTKIVNRIYAFIETSTNDFLLGTDKGLYRYRNHEMREEHYGNPLLGHPMRSFATTIDSSLWIATEDEGLLRLRHGRVTAFGLREHLLSDNCTYLLAEGNSVYVATDKGLCMVRMDQDSVHITTCLLNGLASMRINQMLKLDENTFLLATGHGLIKFDDRKLPPPPVCIPYLSSVYINDIDRPLTGLDKLHYNENNIQFQFGAINMNPTGKATFCYKLEGVDSGWNYTTSTLVKYAYLRPGHYKFMVTTEDPGGKLNERLASVSLFIETPWWKAWWFILSVVMLGLLSGLLLLQWRISSYKRQVDQRRALAESELKALRAQINPHFIYNSLNSIQDFVLMNQREEANLYLSKFAALIRSILANSRRPEITIAEEMTSLSLYLELEALRFNERFTYRFVVDEGIQPDEVQIPSMILQPYIENAILHGLATVEREGQLTISFKREENLLVCIIEDNGIGRRKAAENRQKRLWQGHASLGMKITEERISLLSGGQGEGITLLITDLSDEDNNAMGTRVSIYFQHDWSES